MICCRPDEPDAMHNSNGLHLHAHKGVDGLEGSVHGACAHASCDSHHVVRAPKLHCRCGQAHGATHNLCTAWLSDYVLDSMLKSGSMRADSLAPYIHNFTCCQDKWVKDLSIRWQQQAAVFVKVQHLNAKSSSMSINSCAPVIEVFHVSKATQQIAQRQAIGVLNTRHMKRR